jgi:acetyltransferase EpsM
MSGITGFEPDCLPHLIIWGASGHARVVADIIRLNHQYKLAGFVDDTAAAPDRFLDLTVYHDPEALEAVRDEGATSLVVAVGDCRARMRLAETAAKRGFTLISAIHPRAIVSSDASIGEGTVVAAGAVVNPGCSIGTNVIVNTGATVDHDCRIGDGVHISPGAHLGGWVTVGRATWLGIGAIVKDRMAIGEGAMIGAGSVVLSEIPDRVVAWGVPAKPMKEIR